jgi:hypothetical protein
LTDFFETTNSIHFLAIIPHHNTLAELENIQKSLVQGFPLYPIICPLCPIDDYTTNEIQLKNYIKTQQNTLKNYTVCITKPQIDELISQNDSPFQKVLCAIDGLPTFESSKIDIPFLPEPFTQGAFTLRYMEKKTPLSSKQNDINKLNEIKEYEKASLTMRIYRLGIVTLKKIDDLQETNGIRNGISWTFSHDVWVKTN